MQQLSLYLLSLCILIGVANLQRFPSACSELMLISVNVHAASSRRNLNTQVKNAVKTLSPQESDLDAEFERIVLKGIDGLQTNQELQIALETCRAFILKYSNNKNPAKKTLVTRAYLLSGQILRRMGRSSTDKAVGELRIGLLREPNNPDLCREMGLALMDLEKFSEARAYLQKAVQLNRNDRLAWQALVELNEKLGDIEQKIRAYHGLLAIDSTNAFIWTKLGEAYFKLGNSNDAESSFVRALRTNSRQTLAQLELASLKEERGDWAGAIAVYNAILEYDPNNTAAIDRLAKVTPHLQREQKIVQWLRAGNLALQSSDYKQWEKAAKSFDSVLVRDSQNQKAIEGSRKVRKKLYDYWFSVGLRNENTDLSRALDCFNVSLVYADSEQERERAFEKQKQTAIKVGKKIEARNAQEAARLLLESGQFNAALKTLTVTEVLDPTLREKIQPAIETAQIGENYRRGQDAFARGDYELAKSYFDLVKKLNPNYEEVQRYYAEAERQASIKFLVSSSDSAMTKQDWLSARTYLQQVIALAPESTKYAIALKDIERQIHEDNAPYTSRIAIWILAGVIGLSLPLVVITVKSRRRSHKLAELSQLHSIAGFDIAKYDNYRVLTKEWQQAIKALKRQDSATFWIRAMAVGQRVAEACHLEVSFDSLHKRASLSTPIVTSVRASTISTGTRLPANLPLFLLPGAELSESSVTQLYHSIDEQTGSSHRFALMIPFCPEADIQQLRLTLKARQALAYDVVALGFDELRQIVVAIDPIRALRKLILSQVDLSLVSTFTITGPTPDDMFFGREAELREIVQKGYEKSYALIGGRRMGKTSVLLRLHRVRLLAAGFRTINHDCSISTYENFLAAPIHDWRPEPPLNAPTTFSELLHCPPSDKPLVLLLDEADKLVAADRNNGWQLFNMLRALSNSGRAQIMISGERTLREALRDSTSPLFNLANEMLISRLDFRAVEELVTRPMKQLEIELADEDGIVHCIYDFTSGHPNVVQRLCRRLIERLNEQGTRRITINEVNAVIQDPGFQRDDFLSTYWEGTTVLERIISLLMAEDEHVRTLSRVRQALANRCGLRPSARAVDDALQRLVDLRSILGRTPNGYTFAVKAFPRVVANTVTSRDMLEVLAEEFQEQTE